MQRIALFFFLLTFGMYSHAGQGSELHRLESCVQELSRKHTSYQNYLPHWFFHLDNSLHQMVLGIGFLNENMVLLKNLYHKTQISTRERHLISNSVVGCKKYIEHFESRTNIFLLFFASGIVLGLFFSLRLFLALMPETEEVPFVATDQNSPQKRELKASRHAVDRSKKIKTKK